MYVRLIKDYVRVKCHISNLSCFVLALFEKSVNYFKHL